MFKPPLQQSCYCQTCEDESTWTREGRREFAEVLLEDLQAEVKRESCGSTSVKLSLGNCVLDDLRTGLEEAEEEKEEDVEEEGSTRESSVDAVLELEKQPHEPRIRRYTFNEPHVHHFASVEIKFSAYFCRMVEKRVSSEGAPAHLISLGYNLTSDNITRSKTFNQ